MARSNIGNAKLGGLEADLGLTQSQYQWSLSIFYFSYVIFDLPSNIVMRRWRASHWLGILMGLWGVVATAMAACTGFSGLVVSRFFLGVFEAGAFGGLLAYGISQIPSDRLKSWQWLFIIEGVPSIILAVFSAWYLPNDPETAKFLSQKERDFAVSRLADDGGVANDHSWSWTQVASVFKDWKTYMYMLIYITGTSALQGVTLFLPSIIADMGNWSKPTAQALTTPPYFIAFLATIAISYSSDKFFERGYHMILINLFALAGFLMLMFVPRDIIAARYVGSCIVTAAVYANVPVKVAWFNNNYGGLTRRAVASAVIVSIGTIGGAIGGQIYYDGPLYFAGNTIAFSCMAAQTVLVLILRFALARENRRRDKMTKEVFELEIEKYGGMELVGDRHPTFRYIL
ncbi:major facilitator superfamily domain-containing protein [Spinellus fusiger]|nr:major facilitator superfamily domain-containing protein [Spinellus fusiger]